MDTTGPLGPATLGTTPATPTDAATTTSPAAATTTVTATATTATASPAVEVSPSPSPSADVTVYSPVVDSVAVLSPSNVVVPVVTPTPVALAPYVVVNYGQCGGTKVYCDQVDDCVDAVWSGASCNPGFACNRYDETWWQCQPTSRRLLRLR